MVRLKWGELGERYFELGVDRGVLYVGSSPGVPWNGLTSVTEKTVGSSVTPLYIDGFKYLNVMTAGEFEATLEAYGAPLEFNACDGVRSLHAGLFATQQPRAKFGLSYRSKIGNDLDGTDHGYKIHLVYNAMAEPSERSRETISDDSQPLILSWNIHTTPVKAEGYKATAHFALDSRYTDPGHLEEIENLLYGVEFLDARLPSISEIIDILES